jgi:PAS domain S-box-containing protein
MTAEANGAREYRVLVLAPTRRDREVTLELLRRANISSASCEGALSLAAEVEMGVGAILLTDAAFSDPHIDQLLAALSCQPPWSDVPVILLCRTPPSPVAAQVTDFLRNITVLERPSSSRTLLSSVRAAMRARAHQYQLREQFEALRASEAALRASELQFRTMANSIPQLAWMAHADGYIYWYNHRWYEYTGTTPQEMEGWGWQSVHDPKYLPKVLERWRTSIVRGTPFDMEFPLRAADGQFRMFLTRVVPLKSVEGQVMHWFGTNTDIEEAKRTEMQLRATEAALRDADHRKDIFLATLAHELRNPLAPIRTAAQMLGSPELSTQQSQWVKDVIQRQVRHMSLLLDDLLDIARITQGKLLLKTEPVKLTSIVDAAVEAARPLLDDKKHRLTVTLPADALILNVDPLRLSQVLSNLLTNAAKYTDPGGQIELRARIESDALNISVKDDGIGILPETLPRIFVMFSQVDETSARSESGLGMGLALVKGLVELHGGSVEVKSEGPGRGSEFSVQLPLATAIARAVIAAEVDAPPPVPVGRRILVADDNKDAADSLAMLLELEGNEVRVAYNGRAALALAQAFRPDTALLDIGMPELSGYEVAEALRREPWGADICLIALTGWGQDRDRQRANDAGFNHHVTKPVDPGMLEALMTNDSPRRRR